jgi:hypothetical protein
MMTLKAQIKIKSRDSIVDGPRKIHMTDFSI